MISKSSKKRVGIIVTLFAFLIFSSVGVYGQSCSPDQIIMKLSSETNAHGEVWDGGGDYSEEICYPDIFGQEYQGDNPHQCQMTYGVAENEVLSLSETTNAHAQDKRCYLGREKLVRGANYEKMLWNGFMSFKTTKTGTQDLLIRARGECYDGCPHMVLKANNDIIDEWDVTESWQNYTSQADISGEVNISFQNDECHPDGCDLGDRNLIIDYVEVGDEKIEAEEKDSKYCKTNLDPPYEVRVCYGDLKCIGTSDDLCPSDFSHVVSLSDRENAHLETAGQNNYTIRVCCKSGVNITGAYWGDMTESPISETDLNDKVKLIAKGEGFEGEQINYTIYKEGQTSGWNEFWNTVTFGIAYSDSQQASINAKGVATWRADSEGTFYFEAEVVGGLSNATSGNLNVTGPENNQGPHAEILSPEVGAVYEVGQEIEFTQSSYDIDDRINTSWDFNDGNTSSEYNTTYSYSTIGQKHIQLEVEDERGKSDTDRASILVIDPSQDRKYIFAHINQPEWGQDFEGKEVDFSANATYSIETNNNNISCIAGDCPEQTSGGSNIEGTPNWIGFENIQFNWTFSDGSQRSGYGMDGSEFTKIFVTPSLTHWAELTASINPSSSTRTEFSVFFEYPTCVNNGRNWIIDGNYVDSMNDCYRENVSYGSNYCCPVGHNCENTDSGWKCIEDLDYNDCSDYNSQEACESYSEGVAEEDIKTKTGKVCGEPTYQGDDCWEYITDCRCFWNESASNSQCQSAFNTTINCEDTDPENGGRCNFETIKSTNCTGGIRFIEWSASWTGEGDRSDDCKSGSKEVPCLSTSILSFFNIVTAIIALILVAIFYLIVTRKTS